MAVSTASAQDAQLPEGLAGDLPDFSWAGYHAGEEPLPKREATLNAADFGARGDDETDDTKALQAAVAEACRTGGVVEIPPGRYILTDVLAVSADNVVLRGAGSEKTTLYCPKSLTQIRGPNKNWSWGGGMIEVKGGGHSEPVATLREDAPAGATRLAVEFTGKTRPKVGEWLEIRWFNDKGEDTLLDYLYGGVIPRSKMGSEMQAATGQRVRDWVRVEKVGEEELTIRQPLSLDALTKWKVQLVRAPLRREVGIEGLTIEFPRTTYPGHLNEKGYNCITLSNVLNCWVRDLRTINADSGVIVGGAKHVTVQDVLIQGRTMHHPLCVSWGADCLVTDWRIEAPHVHGTTLSWSTHRTVYSRGWGDNLAMDSHRACSFENLHTDITIANMTRPFRSGGSGPRGPHTARRNVYWNVKAQFAHAGGTFRVLGHDEWPLGLFVGWHGNRKLLFDPIRGTKQQVVELNETPAIENLHLYQFRARTGSLPTPQGAGAK